MTRPSDISPELWERADLLRDQFRHIDDDLEYTARVILAVESERKAAALGLTAPQKAVAEYLAFRSRYNQPAPSHEEIAASCGLRSKSTVHRVVRQLQERGVVTFLPHRPRSIALVERA